jgi:hypothetical protein
VNETAPTAPIPPPIAPGAAVAGIFTSPGATFCRLLRRPTWWLPFVLYAAIAIGTSFLLAPKVDWDRSAQEALAQQAEKTGRAVPPEAVPRVAGFMKLTMTAGAPAFVAFLVFAMPLVLWGAARAFGGEVGYAQTLSLWIHANLPNVVKGLVSIPVVLSLAGGSLSLKGVGTVLKSNVASFLPEGSSQALQTLGSFLDVFTLWSLVLVVIAFRRIPGLPKGAAGAIPVVLFVLLVLGLTGLAALRG